MEKTMKKTTLPTTDSVRELACFWDKHDLSDFEEELEEVKENVFDRCKTMNVNLDPNEFKSLEQIARKKGLSDTDLIREWIREKLRAA
jgi:predicted phosphatase